MASKFHLKTASNGQFHFNLHAGNGEIILSSEQYKACLLYTSPSPRDKRQSRMPSSA